MSFKSLLFSFLTLWILASCSRTKGDEDFVGPAIPVAGKDFTVTGDSLVPAVQLINFQNGPQFFRARFSQSVAWKLLVKGQLSGAEREFSGTSAQLDSANTAFHGASGNLYFFRPGEVCTAELSITGWSKTYRTSFVVNKTPVFDAWLIDDFESPGDSTGFANLYTDSGDSLLVYRNGDQEKVFEGLRSLKLSGFDYNGNYWLSMLTSRNVDLKTKLNDQEPGQTWLNFYGTGQTDGHAQIELQLKEDQNNDGVFTSGTDELWTAKVVLSDRWGLHSLRFSDFTKSGTGGDGTLQLGKSLSLSMILIANPPGGYTEAWLDYVNITFGQAFRQQ